MSANLGTFGSAFISLGFDSKNLRKDLGGIKGQVASMGKSIMGALGPLTAFIGGFVGIKASISAIQEQERVVVGLDSALKSAGATAASLNLQQFASDLQSVTRIGDEASLKTITLGVELGLNPEQAKEATKAAVGLSAILGIDLQTAMQQIAKESSGVSSTLARQIPALDGVTSASERLAIISEMASKGLEKEKDLTKTSSGAWTQFTNALGDASEKIGELIVGGGSGGLTGFLLDVVARFQEGIQVAIDWKTSLIDSFNSGSGAVGTFGSVVKTIFGYVKDAFDLIVFSVANFELSFDVMVESAQNAFTLVVARGKWLGEALMTVAEFFWNNWKEIFTDVGNFAMTIFENMVENTKTLFTELWKFIKSGGTEGFEVTFKGITEGFQSSLKESLNIKDFVPPEMKDEAAKRFAEAFEQYKQTEKDVKKAAEKAKEEVEKEFAKPIDLTVTSQGYVSDKEAQDKAEQDRLARNAKADQDRKALEEEKKKKGMGDAMAGGQWSSLADVWKKAQEDILKKQDTVPDKIYEEAKKQNQLVSKQTQVLNEMNNRLERGFSVGPATMDA